MTAAPPKRVLPKAFCNGRIMAFDDIHVSPLDRGFLFADSVYEVIPCYQRTAFQLKPHIARLRRSLSAVGIESPYSDAEWTHHIAALIEANSAAHQQLYLQVTRGADTERNPLISAHTAPTVIMFAQPLTPATRAAITQQSGIALISYPDLRWSRCDIKANGLLPNILARQQAHEHGAQEALLIRDGWVTEGSNSNVFVVHDGNIHTPPLNHQILGGVTRDLVLELAGNLHIPVAESPCPESWLRTATEIWITSSTRGLVPAASLDGQPVGTAQPGPVWHQLAEAFADHLDALLAPSAQR